MKKNTIRNLAIATGAVAVTVPAVLLARKYFPPMEKKDPEKKTILCVGDSVTFGAGVSATRKRDAWPYLLDRMLPEKYEVLNYGISGSTMVKTGDKPYSRRFLNRIDELDLDMIILMLGTNDSKPYNWDKDQFELDYAAMLERLIKNDRKIVIMIPPKAFKMEGAEEIVYDIADEPINEGVKPVVRKMAEKYRLPCIDLYAMTEEHPEYFVDGVHPNALGNMMIAEKVYKKIINQLDL